jgi:uncharacterized protein YegP (UPF0339 family)
MASTSPRFRVKKDNSGFYYWIFYGANGEAIARSSESYVAKRDCLHSIALVKRDSPGAPVYDWTVPADANGNYSAIPEAHVV